MRNTFFTFNLSLQKFNANVLTFGLLKRFCGDKTPVEQHEMRDEKE